MTPNDGPDAAPAAPDQPHRLDADESSRPDDAPPGSVAAEAALLVDLLSRRTWSGSSRMPSGDSRGERAGGAAHGHDHAAGPASPAGDPTGPDAARRPDGSAGECTCGGTTPAACRVCPVCQLIAFVQQVNPDTIEKVADFVGFAATALRDLATAQRERRAEPAPDRDTDRDDAHPSADADDIDADDIDADENGPGGSA
ncbi:hypothetical protein ASH01_20310 [Terrabacter sp. Soil811]|uniref:hypothetical protein n=1 Tax=Terrabacter sp. Soil811 TaxID=1736419 RepID=UPI0006F21628|nr:hypothetical protein [Terrabacter sp. Soil811]KRF39678.1 hypothetical protein ASH01_20310 [Terrabacter sp. Soil811]